MNFLFDKLNRIIPMKTHIEPSTVNSVLQDKNEAFITKDNITVYLLKKEHITIIEKIWRQLEISNKDVGLTCRWDWVKTWIDHYEDVVNYWFVAGVQNNIPCGIALFTKETNRKLPLSVKSFHIGTSGEPYQDMVRMINNTLLTTPESKEIFYSALIEIISTYFQWEEIVCDDFSSEDALVVQKIITKNPHRFTIEKNTCRYFDFANLKENKKNVLSNLSSTARYKIKRSLKEFGNDVIGEW